MSVSGISSSNTNVYQFSSQQHGPRYYIRQLGQALQSGDLASAQQAYASLSQFPQFQNGQGSQSSTGTTSVASVTGTTSGTSTTTSTGTTQGSTFAQAIAQVGSDLQAGNLSGAQQAFSALQQQWQGSGQAGAADTTSQTQGIKGHHHHHHGGGGDASAAASSTSDPDSPSSSSSGDPLLDMLTEIENTLASIQTDLSGESGSGATGTGTTGTTTPAATTATPVNILT